MNASMLSPKDLASLAAALGKMTNNSRIIAGGTDLVIAMREGRLARPDLLVNVLDVKELRSLTSENGVMKIGAAVCFSEIAGSKEVSKYFPALAQAAVGIGSKQVRNRGTIGGNIANASPAGDMLPPLIALNARVLLLQGGNITALPLLTVLSAFVDGSMAHNCALIAVEVPYPAIGRRNCFVKLGSRKAVSIARLSMAVNAGRPEDGSVSDPIVVLGALGRVPARAKTAEASLAGQRLTADAISQFAEALSCDVDLAIPGRYSQPYKREAVKGLAYDAAALLMKQ